MEFIEHVTMLSWCDFNWVCISFQSWSLIWCLIGVLLSYCVQNLFLGQFWAKTGPCALSFWCLVLMVTQKLKDLHRKMILSQKGPLWAIGAEKRPAERPNGRLPENRRYPELPQDMGDLWSHWVGSVWPSPLSVPFLLRTSGSHSQAGSTTSSAFLWP